MILLAKLDLKYLKPRQKQKQIKRKRLWKQLKQITITKNIFALQKFTLWTTKHRNRLQTKVEKLKKVLERQYR